MLFALAGAAAAAFHVTVETPGALRDWRQTLPLAAALGACVGALLRPAGARAGAAATLAALACFALVFALGHGLIEGRPAAAWRGLLGAAEALIGRTGALAILLGAGAGALVARSRRA